ncbi:MAG: hypothetical protein DRH43_00825 [Deltaproteobacteria bacterium]|nr:MAG: hypothetical protein DRH43_00825 [Deltaproteobacteria bacterium]
MPSQGKLVAQPHGTGKIRQNRFSRHPTGRKAVCRNALSYVIRASGSSALAKPTINKSHGIRAVHSDKKQ